MRVLAAAAVAASLLVAASPVRAAGNPNTAALQAALRARGLYRAGLDGIRGPATIRALRRAQARAGLAADGVVGPRTRQALRLRLLGGRLLHAHMHGTDVLALQFALAEHGFPCGTFDGVFGDHTVVALRRFQRFAGLAVDGVAGAGTVRALHAPPPHAPFSIAWPLDRRIGDPFGPRGLRFHEGIDLPAATGSGVVAVAPGRVSWAGFRSGGWGLLVVVAHRDHVRSLYAHLSRIDVRVGEHVEAGFQIGRVGATGDATGPHLHFELRVRGAAINPVPALQRYH